MLKTLTREWEEFRLLLKSVPPVLTAPFILSVFSMNLLANKSISLPFEWMALDCGILVSWFTFLAMDMITRHFGPKAATQLSLFAIPVNLTFCLLLFLGSLIPGVWGESYVPGSEDLINLALNHTFGGTWYVLAGSTLAFAVSAVVNNFTNWGIGQLFRKHPDGWAAYVCRSYLSTAVGQFTDNLVFALTVSHFFFGWTLTQCVVCALTGMLAELLCEILFSRFGFLISEKWKRENIGAEYLRFRQEKEKHQA